MENKLLKPEVRIDDVSNVKSQDSSVLSDRYFLREGLEKWFEIVAEYWGNLKESEEIEKKATDNPKTQLDILMVQFHKAIGEVHHRLASSIGAFRNALLVKDFGTKEQVEVLNKIIENSTREGKIKRYHSLQVKNFLHPVQRVYGSLLEDDKSLSIEKMESYEKEVYEMGVSIAEFKSIEELTSWFVWAGGNEYVLRGNRIPILFYVLREGNLNTNGINDDELVLLKECTCATKARQSGIRHSDEEIVKLKERSDKAVKEWCEKYLPKLTICPSFMEYIKSSE
jgi:hypothetical protein